MSRCGSLLIALVACGFMPLFVFVVVCRRVAYSCFAFVCKLLWRTVDCHGFVWLVAISMWFDVARHALRGLNAIELAWALQYASSLLHTYVILVVGCHC